MTPATVRHHRESTQPSRESVRTPLAAVLGLLVSGSALAVVPSPASAEHTPSPTG